MDTYIKKCWKGDETSNIKGRIVLEKEQWSCDRFEAHLCNGSLVGHGKYGPQGADLVLEATDILLPPHGAVGSSVLEKLNLSLHGQAKNLLKFLNGTFSVTLKDMTIRLPKELSQSLVIEKMTSSGRIKKGLMRGKITNFVSPHAKAEGQYFVHLPKQEIQASLKGKLQDFPVALKITGSLHDPQVHFDWGNMLGGALRGFLDKFLK